MAIQGEIVFFLPDYLRKPGKMKVKNENAGALQPIQYGPCEYKKAGIKTAFHIS
jgi:hypothetical protein